METNVSSPRTDERGTYGMTVQGGMSSRYDRYVSNTYSNNYDDPPRISSNKDVYHERPRMMRPQKYIGKNCYHHIECTTTTFLAAFMSRRPLNSVVSTTTTHRKAREDV